MTLPDIVLALGANEVGVGIGGKVEFATVGLAAPTRRKVAPL